MNRDDQHPGPIPAAGKDNGLGAFNLQQFNYHVGMAKHQLDQFARATGLGRALSLSASVHRAALLRLLDEVRQMVEQIKRQAREFNRELQEEKRTERPLPEGGKERREP